MASEVKTYKNYINGQWVEPASGKKKASTNPANVKDIVGYLPMSEQADVDKAVAAAASRRKRGVS